MAYTEAMKEAVAEALGKTVADVTDEDIKGTEERVARLNAAMAPTPEIMAQVDTEKLLRGEIEARDKQLADQALAFDRKIAEFSRPDIDPDESRIALDKVSRIKSLPELEWAIHEPAQDEEIKALQIVHDDILTLTTLCGDFGKPKPVKELNYYRSLAQGNPFIAKALDTATAGEGLEWAPAEYSSELVEAIYKELTVASLFPRIIQPRGPTYVMPFGLTGGTAYLQGEAEADNTAKLIWPCW